MNPSIKDLFFFNLNTLFNLSHCKHTQNYILRVFIIFNHTSQSIPNNDSKVHN
jgi:hypothetical protein